MKSETTKKLKQIYNICEDSLIKKTIEEIFRIETNTTTGKFNWYNYTMNQKSIYTALTGVFHQNGYKIASDQHILIAHQESYIIDLENKIVNKKGEILINRFPTWQNVIPATTSEICKNISINFAQVEDLEREIKLQKKLNKDIKQFIKIENTYFSAELFIRFICFLNYANKVDYYINNKGYLFYNCDDTKAVVMPVKMQGDPATDENIKIYNL